MRKKYSKEIELMIAQMISNLMFDMILDEFKKER
jgi:hypothetical protein